MVSPLAKIGLIVVAAIALQFFIGAALGDDNHEAWSRPLRFALLFVVLFPVLYWWEKRKEERD